MATVPVSSVSDGTRTTMPTKMSAMTQRQKRALALALLRKKAGK